VEDFGRLYLAEPGRLGVRDSRGRAAAHQAAAKNKLNILQFIAAHGGGMTHGPDVSTHKYRTVHSYGAPRFDDRSKKSPTPVRLETALARNRVFARLASESPAARHHTARHRVRTPGDDPRKECEECGNARGSNVRYYPT
jgi:hypothetical protein